MLRSTPPPDLQLMEEAGLGSLRWEVPMAPDEQETDGSMKPSIEFPQRSSPGVSQGPFGVPARSAT